MKINKDAYVSDKNHAPAYAMAFGKMEAHLQGLIEKVEMGDNPLAKEYLEELKQDGFIDEDS